MENIEDKIVRVFVCPCGGNRFILAGKPNENPTLVEKREIGELISMGCTVRNIPLKQFKQENFEYCGKHTP